VDIILFCCADSLPDTMSSTPPGMLKTVILIGGPSKGCYSILVKSLLSLPDGRGSVMLLV
jgi:hypothetical protein